MSVFATIGFSGVIEIGLRVGKLGNSSVRYELASSSEGKLRVGCGLAFARLRGSRDAKARADANGNSHGTRTTCPQLSVLLQS